MVRHLLNRLLLNGFPSFVKKCNKLGHVCGEEKKKDTLKVNDQRWIPKEKKGHSISAAADSPTDPNGAVVPSVSDLRAQDNCCMNGDNKRQQPLATVGNVGDPKGQQILATYCNTTAVPGSIGDHKKHQAYESNLMSPDVTGQEQHLWRTVSVKYSARKCNQLNQTSVELAATSAQLLDLVDRQDAVSLGIVNITDIGGGGGPQPSLVTP